MLQRRISGKGLQEDQKGKRVTKQRPKEIMKVEDTIVDEVRTKQLVWYGHVQRMEENRLPKQVLTWNPAGRRLRGKPRKSWREGIDSEIKDTGLDENFKANRCE